MIDFEGADEYFRAGHHVRGGVWGAYSEAQRAAAVASARRILSRGLSRSMRDDLGEYEEGDRYRDDFAVYEQALYMLEHGRIVDTDAGAPYAIAVDTGPAPESPTGLYSPEALRWLGWTGAAVIRG